MKQMNFEPSELIQGRREENLKKRLSRVLKRENLESSYSFVEKFAEELNINYLECAAALCFLQQNKDRSQPRRKAVKEKPRKTDSAAEVKMVRYRLDVGRNHNVSVEDIKRTLVEESGVEKDRIGFIHLHSIHSTIDLPEGMPSDIFHHLKSVKINNKSLQIKRMDKKKDFNKLLKRRGARGRAVKNKETANS